MAATKTKRTQPAQRPEHKIGPFHNGLAVAIWINSVETDKGIRYFRSLTLAPRRYRDAQTGEWKDAVSYRPVDLSTLVLALESARRYCSQTPLPGQPLEGHEEEEIHGENGELSNGQSPS